MHCIVNLQYKENKLIQECILIAEIANAHCGDFNKLKNLVNKVTDAGCNNIKFQLFNADDLVTKNHPKYAGYVEKQFTKKQWEEIATICKIRNINVYCDVFDMPSLILSKVLKPVGYKIHSTNLDDDNFIAKVCKETNFVIMSTGGCFLNEIQHAVRVAKLTNPNIKIVLMTGIQNFPTKLEDTHLNKIRGLKKYFVDNPDIMFGLQDHISGDDYLSRVTPFIGKVMGYHLIEKHITLNRAKKETDYFSSLNPDEFKVLIDNWKKFDTILGNETISVNKLTDAENNYRKFSKRSAVITRDMKKGEILSMNAITFKRSPSQGIERKNIYKFLGKKIKVKIKEGEIVKGEYFE